MISQLVARIVSLGAPVVRFAGRAVGKIPAFIWRNKMTPTLTAALSKKQLLGRAALALGLWPIIDWVIGKIPGLTAGEVRALRDALADRVSSIQWSDDSQTLASQLLAYANGDGGDGARKALVLDALQEGGLTLEGASPELISAFASVDGDGGDPSAPVIGAQIFKEPLDRFTAGTDTEDGVVGGGDEVWLRSLGEVIRGSGMGWKTVRALQVVLVGGTADRWKFVERQANAASRGDGHMLPFAI